MSARRTVHSLKVKVMQSLNRPGHVLRVPGGWGSKILRQSAYEGGKVVSPTHRPPLPPRKYSWYSFLLEFESCGQKDSSSSVICQTTGPKPLPKRFLHIVRSRASSFNWQYPLLSLRSSSTFLRLLPRLLVISICLFIFPSITCRRRQFLRKMWPIQLAYRVNNISVA